MKKSYMTPGPGYCRKILFFRPRPDFLERCFPDGKIDKSMKCTGSEAEVIDGYKSFPSGHASSKLNPHHAKPRYTLF